MTCQPIARSSAVVSYPFSSEGNAGESREIVYLCDSADDRPLVARSASGAPTGPSLVDSARLFAVPPLAVTTISAPPSSPMARLVYDVTTQLTDFELSVKIRVPVQGLNSGREPVSTVTEAFLRDQGAIAVLGVEFHPAVGPRPIPVWGADVLSKVPIVGPFFKIRILRLFMDSATRQIRARVQYLWFPFNQDAHQELIGKSGLSPELMRGNGYDLTKGVPVYLWQMVELIERVLREKGAEGVQAIGRGAGLDRIVPLLDQGEVLVEGNFSNKTVDLRGMHIRFAPLPPGQKHRIRITGRPLEPIVTAYGLRAAEFDHPRGRIRLVNEERDLSPLEVHLKIDPSGVAPLSFEIPSYQSRKVVLETVPEPTSNLNIRLALEEGIDVRGLIFRMDGDTPRVEIRRLVAKQIVLDAFGVHLRTNSGDQAVMEDLHATVNNGKPVFFTKIQGRANGEVNYFRERHELGAMVFRMLEGDGEVRIGEDAADAARRTRVEISGRISTGMPDLRLVANSEKLQGFVRTDIQDATVAGVGRLAIWPEGSESLIEAAPGENVEIHGHAGLVHLHQDPSQVEAWPELRRELGPLSDRVTTDFFVRVDDIRFNVSRMKIRSHIQSRSGTPALEVSQAILGPIAVRGDLWGRLFTRMPGGIYFPAAIPEASMMKGAMVTIGRLLDEKDDSGRRQIDLSQVAIDGVESQPTFTKRDQKRCGIDRQQIHAVLGLFRFDPGSREFRIDEVASGLRIYLKNQIGGGCLKIE